MILIILLIWCHMTTPHPAHFWILKELCFYCLYNIPYMSAHTKLYVYIRHKKRIKSSAENIFVGWNSAKDWLFVTFKMNLKVNYNNQNVLDSLGLRGSFLTFSFVKLKKNAISLQCKICNFTRCKKLNPKCIVQ